MHQQPGVRHSMTMFPAGSGDTRSDNLPAGPAIDYILTKNNLQARHLPRAQLD